MCNVDLFFTNCTAPYCIEAVSPSTVGAMQDQSVVSLPLKLKGKKSYKLATLHVLKRFEFEPQLLRSGVLAVDSVAPGQALVFRGAPASIQQIVAKDNLPADFCHVPFLALACQHKVC